MAQHRFEVSCRINIFFCVKMTFSSPFYSGLVRNPPPSPQKPPHPSYPPAAQAFQIFLQHKNGKSKLTATPLHNLCWRCSPLLQQGGPCTRADSWPLQQHTASVSGARHTGTGYLDLFNPVICMLHFKKLVLSACELRRVCYVGNKLLLAWCH